MSYSKSTIDRPAKRQDHASRHLETKQTIEKDPWVIQILELADMDF